MLTLRERLREETGSTMIMALVFLMVCLFTGGSVLAVAAANGSRLQNTSQEEQNRRCGMLLLGELLDGEDPVAFQITIRDVTVTGASGNTKRTVRYLALGGESLLQELLLARTVWNYEQTYGIPDSRRFLWNGETRTEPKQLTEDAGELAMILDAQFLAEAQVIEGRYAFAEDGTLTIALGKHQLTMAAGEGKPTVSTLTANGITTVTNTRVLFWKSPEISKGGMEDD